MNIYIKKAFAVAAITVLMSGCSKDNAVAEVQDTTSHTEQVNAAIFEIPASLSSTHQRSASSALLQASQREKHLQVVEVYKGIRLYIKFSNEVAKNIKKVVENIASNNILDAIERGVKHPADKGEKFTHFQIDDVVDGYETKYTFFKDEKISSIIYLTFSDAGVKGRVLLDFEDEAFMKATKGFVDADTLEKEIQVEVLFDSTADTKNLQIKTFVEQEPLKLYAIKHYTSLSSAQKHILDLEQAKTSVLEATFDGETYSISGLSYHPLRILKYKLDQEENPFNSDLRTMYAYRAKATIDSASKADEAKLALAVPNQDSKSVDYDKDAIGMVFTAVMNDKINALYSDVNTTAGTKAYIASVIDTNSDNQVSVAEFEHFIATENNDTNLAFYNEIKFLVNPAYYSKNVGFIGTSNEKENLFYAYHSDGVSVEKEIGNFVSNTQRDLDLSGLKSYAPVELMNLQIELK